MEIIVIRLRNKEGQFRNKTLLSPTDNLDKINDMVLEYFDFEDWDTPSEQSKFQYHRIQEIILMEQPDHLVDPSQIDF